MDILAFCLLAGLGSYGLTYLMVFKSGPFEIFDKIRGYEFCPVVQNVESGGVEAVKEMRKKRLLCLENSTPIRLKQNYKHGNYEQVFEGIMANVTGNISDLFLCPYCLGPYVSLLLVIYLAIMGLISISISPLILVASIGLSTLCHRLFEGGNDL